MHITRHEVVAEQELLAALKQTRLRGHGEPLIYEHATLEIAENVDTARLTPAQRYALRPGVDLIEDLYRTFLERGVDIFHMRGGLLFWSDELDAAEQPVPLIPPVVEESRERDGSLVWLINDGLHRVYAARRLGQTINVVLARNVPEQWPYYAYAIPEGWAGVEELAELPDSYAKKEYRDPSNYKALFRNFNAVLPGIQKQRKRTNPAEFRAGQ